MKKVKQLFSLVLLCATVFGMLHVDAHAIKEPPTVEEELRLAEKVQELLREVGVGTVDQAEKSEYAEFAKKETVYTKVLETNVGAIDVVDYNQTAPDGTPWVILEHWNEGRLGTGGGEELYCANPTLAFRAGYKTPTDASKYYNRVTIQMIAAMFYYYDHYMCGGIGHNYDYLLKQCAVWWVLNEVHHWYDNVVIETGNNVKCAQGHWISTHKAEYMENGMAWAKQNYMFFPDAYGMIYEGDGQPLSKWGGTYQPSGILKLKKVSANTAVTEDNGNYSMEGAEFGVYKEASLSDVSKAGVLKTDAQGISNTLSLQAGTYYVKETKAPKGYALNPDTKTVTVSAGKESVVEFADVPQLCPIEILLEKIDAETGKKEPQGTAALSGAEFTVKYYDGFWKENENPAELGETPKRTWVFVTDQNGKCAYGKEHLLSGDPLYVDLQGNPAVPLGTVTIQETKAPDGYLLNSEIFVRKITSKGTEETVDTYENPVVPERILQLHLVKKQENSEIPIPNAKFEHERPDGTKELVKTNENGQLSLKGLQRGIHRLKEVEVMDGYLVNGNEIIFEISEDNRVHMHSETEDALGKTTVAVTDEGTIVVQMEDLLAPFALVIQKENQKGSYLSGAEFTLYADKMCDTIVEKGVTGKEGRLDFQNLKVGKTYYLKETKAPEGYRIPVDMYGNPIVYELRVESIPTEERFCVYVDGKAYEPSDPDCMFTVAGTKANRELHAIIINETGRKLPETGSWWMIPILTIGGLLCLFSIRVGKDRKGAGK